MNPIEAFKLFGLYNRAKKVMKENIPMSQKVGQWTTLLLSLAGALGLPALATSWLHAHLTVYSIVVAAAIVLHAVFPSIFSAPSRTDSGATGLNKVGVVLLLCVLCSVACRAQAVAAKAAPAPAELQNLYAGGLSYNVGATPAIAGTGLYAHEMASTGTYAFTAIDAVPNTLKPFTVSTNVGVGVAQKIVTISKYPIYVPTAVGISWSGRNTGWQWNAGAATVISIKGQYVLMPTVRFLKSSVSNGSGYQPIIGVLFGWGK